MRAWLVVLTLACGEPIVEDAGMEPDGGRDAGAVPMSWVLTRSPGADLDRLAAGPIGIDDDDRLVIGGAAASSAAMGIVTFSLGEAERACDVACPFLLALDRDGTHRWERVFAPTSKVVALAVAPDGTSYVAIALDGVDDYGGGERSASRGLVVAVYDADGAYVRDALFPTADYRTIATDGETVVLGGSFVGEIDLGGGVRVSAPVEDAFVLALSAELQWRWDRVIGTEGPDRVTSVSVDGSIAVAGEIDGTADLGGGPRTATEHRGFALVLDDDGAHVWDRLVGAHAWLSIAGDDMIFGGELGDGGDDLGNGMREGPGGFIARYSVDGMPEGDVVDVPFADANGGDANGNWGARMPDGAVAYLGYSDGPSTLNRVSPSFDVATEEILNVGAGIVSTSAGDVVIAFSVLNDGMSGARLRIERRSVP